MPMPQSSSRPDSPQSAGRAVVIRAADGFPVAARVFESERPVRATIVIQGATATPQRYYQRFASWLRDAGYRVITFDYRGIGESRPADASTWSVTMADWGGRDVAAVHAQVEADYVEPTLIVGHSFGGQALGLLPPPRRSAGVALVASQFGYTGHWPWHQAAAMRALWHVAVPTLTWLTGRYPAWAGFGVELPSDVARQWARWCTNPDYLFGELPEARDGYAAWALPVMSTSISDDGIAPPRAVAALHACLTRAELRHRVVTPAELGRRSLGHFGYFRRAGAPCWPEIEGFFSELLAAQPRARERSAS